MEILRLKTQKKSTEMTIYVTPSFLKLNLKIMILKTLKAIKKLSLIYGSNPSIESYSLFLYLPRVLFIATITSIHFISRQHTYSTTLISYQVTYKIYNFFCTILFELSFIHILYFFYMNALK